MGRIRTAVTLGIATCGLVVAVVLYAAPGLVATLVPEVSDLIDAVIPSVILLLVGGILLLVGVLKWLLSGSMDQSTDSTPMGKRSPTDESSTDNASIDEPSANGDTTPTEHAGGDFGGISQAEKSNERSLAGAVSRHQQAIANDQRAEMEDKPDRRIVDRDVFGAELQTAFRTATEYDAVDEDDRQRAREQLIEALREAATTAYRQAAGCDQDRARRAVVTGEWADDARAVGLLSTEEGPSTPTSLWLWDLCLGRDPFVEGVTHSITVIAAIHDDRIDNRDGFAAGVGAPHENAAERGTTEVANT